MCSVSVKRKFSKIIANRKKRVFGHIYGPYLFHVVWKNTKLTGRGCLEGWVDVQLHHKFSQFSKRFIYLYFCPDNVWPFWTYLFYRNQTYTVASVPAVTGSVYLPGFRFFWDSVPHQAPNGSQNHIVLKFIRLTII